MPDHPYPTTFQTHQQSQHCHTMRFYAETAVLKGQVVTLGTDDTEVIPSTADDVPLGIAMNEVDAASLARYLVDSNREGVAVEVCIHGIVPILAGAAITMGAYLKSDANGRLVPLAAGADADEQMVGKAYNVAAADGDPTYMWVNMVPSINVAPA